MDTRTATFSLSPAVKRKWLAALRSGKYKQTTGALYDSANDAFCCLGVLCHIEGADKEDLMFSGQPADVDMFTDALLDYDEMTTEQASKHSNKAFSFSVKYKKKLTPLSVLNDGNKLTFKQIANIIERQVPTH